jgi:hypothetical protein
MYIRLTLSRRQVLVALCAVCLISSVAAFRYLVQLTFSRASVTNIVHRDTFAQQTPNGFLTQDSNSVRVAAFKQKLPHLIGEQQSLERAIALRSWVRAQQSDDPSMWKTDQDTGITDPHYLLAEQRNNIPGACRRLAYILLGALVTDGYHARVVSVADRFEEQNALTHTMTEVWISTFRKWVIMDATYDVTYMVDGQPASVLDVHDVLHAGAGYRLSFRPDGLGRFPYIRTQDVLLPYFRHVYTLQTNAIFDGYGVDLLNQKKLSFLHLVDTIAEPFPELSKNVAAAAFVLLGMLAALLAAYLVRHSLADWRQRQREENVG